MSIEAKARRYAQSFLRRPTDAVIALYAGESAALAGRPEVAAALWSLGDDIDPKMLRLEDDTRAPDEARKISSIAAGAIKKHFTRLHAESIDAFARRSGADTPRVREAIWPMTHDGTFEYRRPMQRPEIFYMPDLPGSPVEPTERFPWVNSLQQASHGIRAEYESAVRRNVEMTPYVAAGAHEEKWRELRGGQDWSAIHLFKGAARTRLAVDFPRTLEALSTIDLVSINGVPIEVFFSRLRPGAHIPPHHGLTNTRVTAHLPIDAPDHCEIRVAEVIHRWRDGEIVAFDDSFEHEAWNRSDRDRVVLIFEAPHPDLSAAERKAIERAYGDRQNWLKGRRRIVERFAGGG